MYSPALTRGWHGRALRGVSGHPWASAGLTGPYLKAGCAWLLDFSCNVFLQIWLVVGALRPRVPALERAQPSLVCQVAMPWTRPEGEGWRDSRSP